MFLFILSNKHVVSILDVLKSCFDCEGKGYSFLVWQVDGSSWPVKTKQMLFSLHNHPMKMIAQMHL